MRSESVRHLKVFGFGFGFAFIFMSLLPFSTFANPEIDEDGWCHFPKDANNGNNEVKANGKCGFIDQDGAGGAEGSAYWEIGNVKLTESMATILGKRLRFYLTSARAPNIPCELNTNGDDYLSNDWEAYITFRPYRRKKHSNDANYAGTRGKLSMTLTCRKGAQQ